MIEALLAGPVIPAARGLLGRRLVSDIGGTRTAVVLTEVEAYDGADDPASHAYRGRTRRNTSMFKGPGTLYVYRSYGIHWCMNVVCGPAGRASAVLLRGGAPLDGVEVMTHRRGRAARLAEGPGNLTQALGVTGEHDGMSVLDGPIRIEGAPVPGEIVATPRVGLTHAPDRPWRFVLVR